MQAEFWLQRWREGRTGFHCEETSPLLQAHWPSLALPAGSRVFVPLAGKSRDMLWLASQGYRVLAVELSPLAVEQFFNENDLHPTMTESSAGRHYAAGPIEIVCGDFFDIDNQTVSDCAAVYDRAALIALPAEMRRRYAARLSDMLASRSRMLLVTLEYTQSEMDGPPFSVVAGEVRSLYAQGWQITQLEQRDILSEQPDLAARGLSALRTTVYRLQRLDQAAR